MRNLYASGMLADIKFTVLLGKSQPSFPVALVSVQFRKLSPRKPGSFPWEFQAFGPLINLKGT